MFRGRLWGRPALWHHFIMHIVRIPAFFDESAAVCVFLHFVCAAGTRTAYCLRRAAIVENLLSNYTILCWKIVRKIFSFFTTLSLKSDAIVIIFLYKLLPCVLRRAEKRVVVYELRKRSHPKRPHSGPRRRRENQPRRSAAGLPPEHRPSAVWKTGTPYAITTPRRQAPRILVAGRSACRV